MGAMKKGILFSLLSLLLVINLVSLTALLPDRTSSVLDMTQLVFDSKKDASLHSSISTQILNLYSVSKPIFFSGFRNSTDFTASSLTTIHFSDFGFIGDTNIITPLNSFESYVEDSFSSEINALLDISGNLNIVEIPAYNFTLTFLFDEVSTSLNYSYLQELDITLLVNVTDSTLLSSSFPSDSGDATDPLINITLLDSNGDEVNSTSLHLDSTSSNSPFQWTFSDGVAQFYYGTSGNVEVDTSGLDIAIKNATFVFNDTENILYAEFDADLTINENTRKINII